MSTPTIVVTRSTQSDSPTVAPFTYVDSASVLAGANAYTAARVAAEATARQAAVDAETSARAEAITAETAAREDAVAGEAAARQAAITAEATARAEAVSAETAARQAGDEDVKAHADALFEQVSVELPPVRAAAAADIGAAFPYTGLATVDGVALTEGDRVLLAGQGAASRDGIWVVSGGAWSRPGDFPSGGTIPTGKTVTVASGDSQSLTTWEVSGDGTIDTNVQTWTRLHDTLLTVADGVTGRVAQSLSTAEQTQARANVGLSVATDLGLGASGLGLSGFDDFTVRPDGFTTLNNVAPSGQRYINGFTDDHAIVQDGALVNSVAGGYGNDGSAGVNGSHAVFLPVATVPDEIALEFGYDDSAGSTTLTNDCVLACGLTGLVPAIQLSVKPSGAYQLFCPHHDDTGALVYSTLGDGNGGAGAGAGQIPALDTTAGRRYRSRMRVDLDPSSPTYSTVWLYMPGADPVMVSDPLIAQFWGNTVICQGRRPQVSDALSRIYSFAAGPGARYAPSQPALAEGSVWGARFPGDGTSWVTSTPVTWAPSGSFDVHGLIAADRWVSAAAQHPVGSWDATAGGYGRQLLVGISASGRLSVETSPDGTATVSDSSSVAISADDGSPVAFRIVRQADAAAGVRTTTFYTAPAADYDFTDPVGGTPWAQLGLSRVVSDDNPGLVETNGVFTVGAYGHGGGPFAGQIVHMRLVDGSTEVAALDNSAPWFGYANLAGATADPEGNSWFPTGTSQQSLSWQQVPLVTAALPAAPGYTDASLTFAGVKSSYCSTGVDWEPTGNLTVRAACAPVSWATAGQTLIAQWGSGHAFKFLIANSRKLQLLVSADGDTWNASTSTAVPGVDGQRLWVQAVRAVNTPAAGQVTVTFSTSPDGENWTQLGTPVVSTPAGGVGLFASDLPITVGQNPFATTLAFAGDIQHAVVIDGSTEVAALDNSAPWFGYRGTPGLYTDAEGNVWTANDKTQLTWDLTGTGPATWHTTTYTADGEVTIPTGSLVRVVAVGGGGSGGSGGSDAATSPNGSQSGGGGGAAGCVAARDFTSDGSPLQWTVGTGGAGRAGGAASTGAAGNAGLTGNSGGNTVVTGGGLDVTLTAYGGGGGDAPSGRSAAVTGGGMPGFTGGIYTSPTNYGQPGSGCFSYSNGRVARPCPPWPRGSCGGCGGQAASGTNGGLGGPCGLDGAEYDIPSAASGSAAGLDGTAGTDAAAGSGAGGGGGGGGAPGGKGGDSGAGADGSVTVEWFG